MKGKPAKLIRAAEIEKGRAPYRQRLNPRSRFLGADLSRPGGLERVGVSIAWLKPGDESFAFHAHMVEEEWLYVLSGRATVDMGTVPEPAGGGTEIGIESIEVGPGDFVAFPAPNVPHLVRNTFAAEFVYLMGGQLGLPLDVIDYPTLGKKYLLKREPGQRTSFHQIGESEFPFGPAE
jgi:uncharacterized cupin superfamily protein